MTPYDRCRVAPFGNLRIKACVPLPEAYRSLLRPSSPDEAKAFINCCNWFMQTLTYSRRLSYPLTLNYPKLSKNKIVDIPLITRRHSPLPQPSFAKAAEGILRQSAGWPCHPEPWRGGGWWAQMDLNHR